jgi:hypothetical protein
VYRSIPFIVPEQAITVKIKIDKPIRRICVFIFHPFYFGKFLIYIVYRGYIRPVQERKKKQHHKDAAFG